MSHTCRFLPLTSSDPSCARGSARREQTDKQLASLFESYSDEIYAPSSKVLLICEKSSPGQTNNNDNHNNDNDNDNHNNDNHNHKNDNDNYNDNTIKNVS